MYFAIKITLMKRIIPLLIISLFLTSCGSKKEISKSRTTYKKSNKINTQAKTIVSTAMKFQGTRYKYGGTSKKGMDCSGLVYTSFKKEDIDLPRTSRAMYTKGIKIPLKKATTGDLIFFKTNKNRNVINHVGIIISTKNKIEFIHASTSKGVTISSLNERYWNNCFVGIKRIL